MTETRRPAHAETSAPVATREARVPSLHDAAERLALVFVENGMQRMAARVFCAVLFAEKATVTAGDIAERLDVSAGAVSGAIKTLTTVGLIERVPAPGSRRDHFRFRADAWATLLTSKNHVLTVMREAADEGIAVAGADSPAGERLAEMRDFYTYMLRETELMLERWHAYERRGQA
ncbi:MarR family transcriptional regulator [Longispora sp. K20-0274]|uniref:GbsR/MarR family transcriptional regulator n=1 Tax=Longispora sp. K20-0274 TaxID=3088255 RepID=UPI0039996730